MSRCDERWEALDNHTGSERVLIIVSTAPKRLAREEADPPEEDEQQSEQQEASAHAHKHPKQRHPEHTRRRVTAPSHLQVERRIARGDRFGHCAPAPFVPTLRHSRDADRAARYQLNLLVHCTEEGIKFKDVGKVENIEWECWDSIWFRLMKYSNITWVQYYRILFRNMSAYRRS